MQRLVDFIPAGQFIFHAETFPGDKEVSCLKTNVFNWLSWAKCESWLFNSQAKIQVIFKALQFTWRGFSDPVKVLNY